jgi:hypothetical protein
MSMSSHLIVREEAEAEYRAILTGTQGVLNGFQSSDRPKNSSSL